MIARKVYFSNDGRKPMIFGNGKNVVYTVDILMERKHTVLN